MLSDLIGTLLKNARLHRGLSRAQLAQRGKVSVRLVAELERGQRPNVSLESALTLLNVVGVSLVANATEMRGASAAPLARAERAEQRRQTWTGRRVYMHDEDDGPRPGRSASGRLAAVAEVSKQAYVIASAGQRRKGAHAIRQGRKKDEEDVRRLTSPNARKKRYS